MNTTGRIALTAGPLLYYWPREALLNFYADLADAPVDTITLGEVVCARRHEMKPADWLDLARDLRAAGKEVVLATQALIESEADLRLLRQFAAQAAQGDLLVEAGDASALAILAEAGAPFVLGPHINVYSRAALAEYKQCGATRWVPPLELSLLALSQINGPVGAPIAEEGPLLPTEVFAYGRMPLAFSARCFTARHHRLSKDQCEFRCRDDADGLLLSTGDGEPFLVLNGVQTQSAARQCLLADRAALVDAGVARLRLSPTSSGFVEAIELFDAVFNRGAPVPDAAELAALPAFAASGNAGGYGGLANGFADGRPGLAWSPR